jgi:hypothetical protein
MSELPSEDHQNLPIKAVFFWVDISVLIEIRDLPPSLVQYIRSACIAHSSG